jgi:hypothetical protein
MVFAELCLQKDFQGRLRTGPFKYPGSHSLGSPAERCAWAGEMIHGEHAWADSSVLGIKCFYPTRPQCETKCSGVVAGWVRRKITEKSNHKLHFAVKHSIRESLI